MYTDRPKNYIQQRLFLHIGLFVYFRSLVFSAQTLESRLQTTRFESLDYEMFAQRTCQYCKDTEKCIASHDICFKGIQQIGSIIKIKKNLNLYKSLNLQVSIGICGLGFVNIVLTFVCYQRLV